MKSPVRLNPVSPLLFMTLIYFTFSALVPKSFAVVPPPDGGYPNFTTAEGQNALKSLTTGAGNTAVGWSSLLNVTTGSFNTGVGAGTLALNIADSNTATGTAALLLNTTGTENTANGTAALLSNSDGISNSAFGAFALNSNLGGSSNTAVGDRTLFLNTTGGFNTATGSFALQANTTGSDNTAVGAGALESNTGSENTAIGSAALLFNNTGAANTAIGFQALLSNNGIANTACGHQALVSNTTTDNNTANGFQALFSNTEGSRNTAIGSSALVGNTMGNDNTAIGFGALVNNTTGGNNIALGSSAGAFVTGNHNIHIGHIGFANDSGTIRIGVPANQAATFIAGVSGATVPGGVTVVVDAGGHLGTIVSSQRFKDDIKPMDKGSEAILALNPVTFRYKKELDPNGIPQFGLVAEHVAKVNPDLVARDAKGELYTVRYEAVNAMLLNEFLKEHKRVQEQQAQITALNSRVVTQEALNAQEKQEFHATIARQDNAIRALIATVKEQAAQIQKVSAQLEVGKSDVPVVCLRGRRHR